MRRLLGILFPLGGSVGIVIPDAVLYTPRAGLPHRVEIDVLLLTAATLVARMYREIHIIAVVIDKIDNTVPQLGNRVYIRKMHES